MAEETESVIRIFGAVLDVAEAHGVTRINQFPQGWYHRLDDTWEWVVNGTDHAIEVQPEGSMGATIFPFETAVFYNGWLAGVFTPYGGEFAAGEGANEESFLSACKLASTA